MTALTNLWLTKGGIQSRIHAAGIAFEDLLPLGIAQCRRFDVALGVVVVVAGFRVDAAHRADHFAGKQHVVHRDHTGQQVDARLVVDAGVKEDVVQQVVFEQRLFHFLRQPTEAAPVVRHRAAAVRNDKAQRGEISEQVRGQALHEGGGVRVQVVRAGGVEGAVAAGGHVHHGRDVVLHHFFVDGVPVAVGQRRAGPVAAGRVRVEVDADKAVVLDAAFQLRNGGGRIDAGRLRQHGGADEVVREQLADAVAQLVADGRPGGGRVEVADVVGHEAGARAEDGEVGAALLHQAQLVAFDGVAQLVVGDLQLGGFGAQRRGGEVVDLAFAPVFQRLGAVV
jgi:hypothetical protein